MSEASEYRVKHVPKATQRRYKAYAAMKGITLAQALTEAALKLTLPES